MNNKQIALSKFFEEEAGEGICLAFSGGVDSTLLLKMACDAARKVGGRVHAVTFQTRLHPAADMELASRFAQEIFRDEAEGGGAKISRESGVEFLHSVLEVDELEDSKIAQNPIDRCYRCKKLLFKKLKTYAAGHNILHCVEGTNADDLLTYRPGIRAVEELGIESPLARLIFTKPEVRQLAGELGLSCSSRPSAPCLATRLPYNTPLDFAVLGRLDEGEIFLRGRGFAVVRLRLHGDILRVEIPTENHTAFLAQISEILPSLKALGFPYLTLDLEGFRSGSMDL